MADLWFCLYRNLSLKSHFTLSSHSFRFSYCHFISFVQFSSDCPFLGCSYQYSHYLPFTHSFFGFTIFYLLLKNPLRPHRLLTKKSQTKERSAHHGLSSAILIFFAHYYCWRYHSRSLRQHVRFLLGEIFGDLRMASSRYFFYRSTP
jgi:hypothetical protein